MKDPYQTLGVSRTADADEIRQAYRKLAKQVHPDLHPGDKDRETRFKEINAAYDLLSDPDKRARFDRGEIDSQGAEMHGAGAWGFGGGSGPFAGSTQFGGGARGAEINLDDLLGGLFGRRASPAPEPAGDHQYSVTVGFLDAATGTEKRLTLQDGRTVEVNVPAGVEDRQVLRLRGQGARTRLGAGDALVEVRVSPHRFFKRQGDDIHVEVPVTLSEAVLGARIKVPTIGKPVMVTVPKGSDSGTVLRLRGKGIKRPKSTAAGDQIVTLKVVLGTMDEELEAFAAKRAKDETDPRADMT